ncbi:MAG: TVP38/TMEM64 family protein [Chlamydiia bacterium]|nr:TVP38/TMEM64 family protein [Chlamydiia bacterium]
MRWSKVIPATVLLVAMTAAYWLDFGSYLSFDTLKMHRHMLQAYVLDHPWQAPAFFVAIYTVSTALSLPGGAFLSLFGGFLFPQPWALLYVLLGATLGALAVFGAAKSALAELFRKKAGGLLEQMSEGFQDNAVSYLLFLRLVPLFPFWLVNLAPAFFGVAVTTFAWTTFVGIIPGAFVFTQAGAGLGMIFDSGESFSLSALFNRDMKIALIALGLFALIPIFLKRFTRYHD